MLTQAPSIKGYKGAGMEGRVAKWYAANTRKALDEFKALARQVAAGLKPGSRVLEVAPGPGYFAIELARLGYRVDGLDISKSFVEIAARNAREASVEVAFRQGNASRMPFEIESFDFVFCRAAFKNFADPVGALQEMYRVLKPGGKGLLIDLRRDATSEGVREMVDGMGLGLMNRVITRLTFRFMLLKRAYTKREFEHMLSETEFDRIKILEDHIGLEVTARRSV
jgi:ubiquinone/menaquinone biosynthesis C-methylase UbiE